MTKSDELTALKKSIGFIEKLVFNKFNRIDKQNQDYIDMMDFLDQTKREIANREQTSEKAPVSTKRKVKSAAA
jgi:hypothetical protein